MALRFVSQHIALRPIHIKVSDRKVYVAPSGEYKYFSALYAKSL